MTEGLSSSHTQLKRVPIREWAFTIGDLTCINGYHANRMLLKRRFLEGGYLLQETPHFMLCTRTTAPSTILVHWLPSEEIDADIGNRFMHELKPPGLLSDAQQFGQVFAVVGIDIETESFPIVRAIAEQQQLKHVRFTQADLLAGDFASLGVFDTVTALHILEHFSESDMYRVLSNLLQITSQRLILAVPYEKDEPEITYGHEQLFSRDKLEAVGTWCLQQLGGQGKISYEECAGGLLLIERLSS